MSGACSVDDIGTRTWKRVTSLATAVKVAGNCATAATVMPPSALPSCAYAVYHPSGTTTASPGKSVQAMGGLRTAAAGLLVVVVVVVLLLLLYRPAAAWCGLACGDSGDVNSTKPPRSGTTTCGPCERKPVLAHGERKRRLKRQGLDEAWGGGLPRTRPHNEVSARTRCIIVAAHMVLGAGTGAVVALHAHAVDSAASKVVSSHSGAKVYSCWEGTWHSVTPSCPSLVATRPVGDTWAERRRRAIVLASTEVRNTCVPPFGGVGALSAGSSRGKMAVQAGQRGWGPVACPCATTRGDARKDNNRTSIHVTNGQLRRQQGRIFANAKSAAVSAPAAAHQSARCGV